MRAGGYQPRSSEGSVLHGFVRDHLETFLQAAIAHGEGAGLPDFVEREFRDFLGCGVLARGFARVRCGDCTFGTPNPGSGDNWFTTVIAPPGTTTAWAAGRSAAGTLVERFF